MPDDAVLPALTIKQTSLGRWYVTSPDLMWLHLYTTSWLDIPAEVAKAMREMKDATAHSLRVV